MEIPSEKRTIMAINKIITIKGHPSILIKLETTKTE